MEFTALFSVLLLVISGVQGQYSPSSPSSPSSPAQTLTPDYVESSSGASSLYSTMATTLDSASNPDSSNVNSTDSLNTTEPDEQQVENVDESAGIDEGDDGKADDLADYIMRKIGGLINGGDDDEKGTEIVENVEDQKNVTDDPALKNCSQVATLDRYCGEVPNDVHAYFNNDVSVQGLLNSLFNQTVVNALQTFCPPGSWCLPDEYHTDILQGQDKFYINSPFCSDAMWTCLERVVDLRYDCNEEPLDFLVDVVLLLCDIQAVGDLAPECYARTLEGLYVSYADSTSENGSHKADLEKDDCNDYKVQMTKTYLCADDVCGFDQNLLLQKFSAWDSVAAKAVGVALSCNISRECQNDYGDEDDDYNYSDYYSYNDEDDYDDDDDGGYEEEDEEEEEYEDYKEEMQEIEEAIQKELEDEEAAEAGTSSPDGYDSNNEDGEMNANTGESYEEGDRAMLFGLITMTTVLTLGLLSLIFVGFKSYRRSRFASYRRGYSQLSDEEAKMLRNEYK